MDMHVVHSGIKELVVAPGDGPDRVPKVVRKMSAFIW